MKVTEYSIFCLFIKKCYSVRAGIVRRPYRLSVRTQDFQSWKPGATPGKVTKNIPVVSPHYRSVEVFFE